MMNDIVNHIVSPVPDVRKELVTICVGDALGVQIQDLELFEHCIGFQGTYGYNFVRILLGRVVVDDHLGKVVPVGVLLNRGSNIVYEHGIQGLIQSCRFNGTQEMIQDTRSMWLQIATVDEADELHLLAASFSLLLEPRVVVVRGHLRERHCV